MHRSTQASLAYRRLKTKIQRGTIRHGEQITEQEVSKVLKIGRGPARESLLRLEAEGMIQKSGPYGRRFVMYIEDHGKQNLRSQYELREVIDGLAARCAASHMTGLQIRYLRDLVQRVVACIDAKDTEGRIDALMMFYDFLRNECGNPLVSHVTESCDIVTLYVRSADLDQKLVNQMTAGDQSTLGLAVVVEAIASHEPDDAEKQMRSWTRTIADVVCHSQEVDGRS